jgi:hypothetical protein
VNASGGSCCGAGTGGRVPAACRDTAPREIDPVCTGATGSPPMKLDANRSASTS